MFRCKGCIAEKVKITISESCDENTFYILRENSAWYTILSDRVIHFLPDLSPLHSSSGPSGIRSDGEAGSHQAPRAWES